MAHQTIQLKAVKFGYVDEEHPYEHYPVTATGRYDIGGYAGTFNRKFFYIGFEKCPAEIASKRVLGAQITTRADYCRSDMFSSSEGWWTQNANMYPVEDFDADNLNFETKPGDAGSPDIPSIDFGHYSTGDKYDSTGPDLDRASWYSYWGVLVARNAVSFSTFATSSRSDDRLGMRSRLGDGSLPYLTIHYDDSDTIHSYLTYASGPKDDAYADPRKDIKFSWRYKASSSSFCIKETWEQQSATFYWRDANAENWESIPVNDTSITVPANTFQVGSTVLWRVEGTDDSGATTSIGLYQFSTSDSPAYATPVSPVDAAVDGSKPIEFKWTLTNASGSTPTLVNFWWKLPTEDNQHWHVITNSAEPITSYTVPADFFPSGTIQWMVRAFNKDGTAGPAGIASFACIAAPNEPAGITCDSKPFATFTWQSADQQAYRIVINGNEVVKAFGADKTCTLGEPLRDGEYTAEIYVQGMYGLWSSAGITSFSVNNSPGSAVVLSGSFDVDAELSWATADNTHDFYVYRDGKKIGQTDSLACADRLTLGEHGYYVLNRLPDNNYTRSNLVYGTTVSEETRIRLLRESGWIALKLSSVSTSQQSYKYERQHTTRHITGARFPLLELSEFEDEAVSLDVAFTERIDVRIFEAMKGQVVVIKCRGDNVIVGPLVSLQKTVSDFYTSYSFAIQRVDYEDVIDVQNS